MDESKIMTILGQNGVGKTTLLECMTEILKWKTGSTFINGKLISGR